MKTMPPPNTVSTTNTKRRHAASPTLERNRCCKRGATRSEPEVDEIHRRAASNRFSASAIAQTPDKGEWRLYYDASRPERVQLVFEHYENGMRRHGSTSYGVRPTELRGLTQSQLSSFDGPVRFQLVRDYLVGKFAIDPAFVAAMPMGQEASGSPDGNRWDGVALAMFVPTSAM